MGENFKVLSIDGGGIKGLYSSTILEALEKKYGPISDYFDMLVGTSTGGLIALALSLKIPAKDISTLYQDKGSDIFKTPNFLLKCLPFIKQVAWGGKYKNNSLKKELQALFKDRKLADSNNLLCIPSYNITKSRPYIFKYDHSQGKLDRDNNTKYVDVALATSAAPTFFPIHKINNQQLIDGGVYANNPALIGVLEALKYFVGKDKEFSSLSLLSISSLEIYAEEKSVKPNRSFIKWGDKLFDTSMNGQNFMTDFIMKSLSSLNDIPIRYKRISSDKVMRKDVTLDKTDVKTIEFIKAQGVDKSSFITKNKDVILFFKEKKHYNILKGDK